MITTYKEGREYIIMIGNTPGINAGKQSSIKIPLPIIQYNNNKTYTDEKVYWLINILNSNKSKRMETGEKSENSGKNGKGQESNKRRERDMKQPSH